MKHDQLPEDSFLLRNAAPITLFLVGFICLIVAFIIPETWKPFQSPAEARWFGILGNISYYVWPLLVEIMQSKI